MEDDIYVSGLHGQSRDEEEGLQYMGASAPTGGYSHEEILGAHEILGAALQSARLKSSSGFNSAVAARYARRAPIVQRVQPTKKRRYAIGFGPTAVPPLTTVSVSSIPQVLFRGEKLVDTSPSGPTNLFITGLFVGNKPQLPTLTNAIAVASFAAGALDNEMMFDTCDPALQIVVQVQNIGSSTATWAMTLFGHIVQ